MIAFGCRKAEAPASRVGNGADAAALDARAVDAAALDAAAVDAGVPIDAAPARKKRKPSRREACLDACRKRNMYTDCADAEGMGACPCHCP